MKKYFVIGNPIKHSLSPQLHNYWIKKNNLDAFYDKKKLKEDEVGDLISLIKQNEISGINVTIPFKKTVIPYLDKLSPEAEKTQSVNTITLYKNKLIGHNTDTEGFKLAIKKLNFEIKNKIILILGAGGVVPSLIYTLKNMGANKIIISNRTRGKAEILKKLNNEIEIINWGNISPCDVIINATSIGLNENDEMNLKLENFGKNKLYFDVIYNPRETNFLKIGRKLGNLTENGKYMFIYQAMSAFKLWHGIIPQIDNKVIELLDND